MTFVFEARRLPFAAITEDTYAAGRAALLGAVGSGAADPTHNQPPSRIASRVSGLVAAHVDGLPLWDRCVLLAVLPVVQEGRRRRAGDREAEEQEGNGLSDAGGSTEGEDACSRLPLEVDDVLLALRIVRALDELEVAWDHIRAVRGGAHATAAACPPPPATEEELMMELLLAERGVPGFLREPSSSASSSSSVCNEPKEAGESDKGVQERSRKKEPLADDDVDIAMCFDAQGNSIGMGSAAVYGGHGFHTHP